MSSKSDQLAVGFSIHCFEIILNQWLLPQKCHQEDRTSLRDGHWLPSNSTLKMIRRQHLYV